MLLTSKVTSDSANSSQTNVIFQPETSVRDDSFRSLDVIAEHSENETAANGVTPCDVLITASKISLTIYAREEDMASKKSSMVDSYIMLYNNELESHVPYLQVTVSQPHAVLYCKQSIEKLELACFDLCVRGRSPQLMGQYYYCFL